jgi:hypothetical protein
LATRFDPILPFAPPRLSTTTGWPSCSDSLTAISRPMMSLVPPGGNGTTILIGRTG